MYQNIFRGLLSCSEPRLSSPSLPYRTLFCSCWRGPGTAEDLFAPNMLTETKEECVEESELEHISLDNSSLDPSIRKTQWRGGRGGGRQVSMRHTATKEANNWSPLSSITFHMFRTGNKTFLLTCDNVGNIVFLPSQGINFQCPSSYICFPESQSSWYSPKPGLRRKGCKSKGYKSGAISNAVESRI